MSESAKSVGGRVAASASPEAPKEQAKPATGGVIVTSIAPDGVVRGSEPVMVFLDRIRTLGDKHPRDHLDEDVVNEYAQKMNEGAPFPPVDLYRCGADEYWNADGGHRIAAALKNGQDQILAVVFSGGEREAILHAVGANAGHGKRRSNQDKRKAVMILLQDEEWGKWSDSEIARRCNVSPDLVKSVRDESGADDREPDDKDAILVRRNGKEYLQKRKEAAKPLPAHVQAIAEMDELARNARALVPNGEAKLAESLEKVVLELHEIMGQATKAKKRMPNLSVPLNVYEHKLEGGVKATPEFEKKGLATHALNVGLGCGHQCSYCSSPSLRCRLPAYGELQISPYGSGFAVIDPKSADRISADKPKLTKKDTVMLSACDDAWSPEARKCGVGRKCLERLLTKTAAKVRILTKSAKVIEDLDVAKDDKERVMVGLSTGIPASREDVAAAVEPNASKIKDRLAALKTAHEQGFKTYAMLCPCLPLVGDTEAALKEMFEAVIACGVSDIWLEPVNARGKGLQNTATALRIAGFKAEADAVDGIRDRSAWSKYAADLAEAAVKVAGGLGVQAKLHVLMYADSLAPADLERVKALGGAVIRLGKDAEKAGSAADDGDAGKEPEKGGDAGEHAA